jgi:hypothetical protein
MQTELLEPDTETPSLELLPRADAEAILNGYLAKAQALRHTAETLTVTVITDTAGLTLARNTRLSLRAIRIETEKRRVAMVEDMTRETRRINAAAKAVKDFIEPLEERLLEQEQFVDREKERLLNERRQTRLTELSPFLTSQPPADVGLMEPDVYASFLADAKTLHGIKVQREREAEEARQAQEKADAEERERMRLENEKLRAEAEAREAEAHREREAAAAKQREIEAAAAKELKEAADALAKEREAREAAERRQQQAAAAEQRRINEELRAEEARRAAEAQAARKAAAAPDKQKLMAFVSLIQALPVPMLSAGNHHIQTDLIRRLAGAVTWIKAQADEI